MTDKVLNFAHRGASHDAPENTLAAFRQAREVGADGIELDVQVSKDGEAVVIHDFTVDRTTNGQGAVKDKTLAELRELDAGSWFDERFADERIPTLEEVIVEVGQQLVLNIEIKARILSGAHLTAEVVRLIEDHNLVHRVIVSSSNPLVLRRIKRLNPHISTGLLYSSDLPGHLLRTILVFLANPDALHPEKHLVTQEYMAWAKERGYRVNVWTVDEPGEMERLMALGVDGIITNRPKVLASLIDR